MTPLNPAPRPCTLWGSTFEAYRVRKVTTYQDTPYVVCVLDAANFDLAQFEITSSHVSWSLRHEYSRKVDFRIQEAITAIYKALHPPLCMKHALEVGYAFQDESIYSVKVRGSAKPQYLYGHEITSEVVCTVDMVDWFQPDAHGEAEAVVNVWKE